MMTPRRIFLGIAALVMAVFPAAADGPPRAELAGTSWVLATLNGAPVPAEVSPTLVISADRIGGKGGCNTYGGNIEMTPTGIDITNVFSTMMACEGLSHEQAFFAALEATANISTTDGKLQLLDGAGNVLAELTPAG